MRAMRGGVELRVEGMMCNGCRGKVERALAAVDGVASAAVVLETKTATVAGTATAAALIAAVDAVGKSASLLVAASNGAPIVPPGALAPTTPPTSTQPPPLATPLAAIDAAERGVRAPAHGSPAAASEPLLARLGHALQPAAEETSLLRITGMHCAACVAAIERRLGGVAGVSAVSVSLMGKRGQVVHSAGLPPADLLAAVQQLGFKADILDEADAVGDNFYQLLQEAKDALPDNSWWV